jgi:hypothetical protein
MDVWLFKKGNGNFIYDVQNSQDTKKKGEISCKQYVTTRIFTNIGVYDC